MKRAKEDLDPDASVQVINDILEKMARANDGTNHGSDYFLIPLPDADSLWTSLCLHYCGMGYLKSSPQPSEWWHMSVEPVSDPEETLLKAVDKWFFDLEWSPSVTTSERDDKILRLVVLLDEHLNWNQIHEVRVDPIVFYDCVWQDFAFEGDRGRWLLHFGFSD